MHDRFATARWPKSADLAASDRLLAQVAALGRAGRRAAARPSFRRALQALGGNSPYLSDLAVRELPTMRATACFGPNRVMAAILRMVRHTSPTSSRTAIAKAIRVAKRQAALVIALADLGGLWRLNQVTSALSALADATLDLALAHLLHAAHTTGELRLQNPTDPLEACGFTILGMGKLGAGELNYSSDIDLILLFDPERHPGQEGRLGQIFTRLARNLVTLMETRDQDGYVFRTDLRLRPDPASTPPALSILAALTYYESLGQTWERAAMIKARPVAGDRALGDRFLLEIRPFVWRRHLDFAAIADLHGMKQRIDRHKGTALSAMGDLAERLSGHDLKLGQGGIREIEFIAQTLQLVWAGRDPTLRSPETLASLRLLCEAGRLPRRTAAQLALAYRFLRRAEHRLQMVADRQIHTLPDQTRALLQFSVFMGFTDPEAFLIQLHRHLVCVRSHYATFFEHAPTTEDTDETPAFLHIAAHQPPMGVYIETLRASGFADPARVLAIIAAWQDGGVRAFRSVRAKELLQDFLPPLLSAVAAQPAPDQVLARFDTFLSGLSAGIQVLSLLVRNPPLLNRLARILGAAPQLANHLAQVPGALDSLLTAPPNQTNPLHLLRAQLRDARLLEDTIQIIRRFVRGEEFRLSVAVLEGWLDVDRAGLARTTLADAAITLMLEAVTREHEARHGTIPGGGLVVVALGKAGGQEMVAGSDLDLMLITDHPDEIIESQHTDRPITVSQYYTRLAHRLVAALTMPGIEGPLYAVDMRLRPSGNKGPVAVSMAAFQRYHAESAWTWERMALTRARVIAGLPVLQTRVEHAIRTALCQPQNVAALRADARAMRARMLRDRPPVNCWDVKNRPGGLVEVEFIAQTLQLQRAARHPDVLAPSTCVALRRLAMVGTLSATQAEQLVRANRIWRIVQDMLRVMLGGIPEDDLPNAIRSSMVQLIQPISGQNTDNVSTILDATAIKVRAIFINVIGNPEHA